MGEAVQPLLAATFLWWLSTGVLFWLVGLPRASFRWTALAATALMLGATAGLIWLRDLTGPVHAYLGFAAGLALWAWHETLFLLGYVAGPRRDACPPGLKTWPRFIVSAQAVLHHELMIAAHAVIIVALSWGADNQIAAWTYLVLWAMRINAKFVVFLGAPNISDDFLPDHLTYLSSYFGKRKVTAFFPVFISVATVIAAVLSWNAFTAPPGSFESTGLLLLAALSILAVLEHWALVLPIPDSALWGWAQHRRQPAPISPSHSTQDTNNKAEGQPHGL